MRDAERKIHRVHGILQAKNEEVNAALTQEQAQIDHLQAQIELENLRRELKGVRHACAVEDSRLQAARVFFGHVTPPAGGQQG